MPDGFNEQNQLIISFLCIAVLVASGILFSRTGTPIPTHNGTNSSSSDIEVEVSRPIENNDKVVNTVQNKTKEKYISQPQPTCSPIKKDNELKGICKELIFTKFSCKPEDIKNPDKHKIPKFYFQNSVRNNSSHELQNNIVNYIIGALLLTSLGAAILELYRAKLPPPSSSKRGAKPLFNRKCSLADLTVLKHHRKELVRRESILEIHSEEQINTGNKHQGTNPSPLHRRCSFHSTFPSNELPLAGGGGFSAGRNSRKYSMTADINRRISVINDGPKLSMVTDEEFWRRGSLMGEDASPERRHHLRLVHRH